MSPGFPVTTWVLDGNAQPCVILDTPAGKAPLTFAVQVPAVTTELAVDIERWSDHTSDSCDHGGRERWSDHTSNGRRV